jgi:hypothetical protein
MRFIIGVLLSLILFLPFTAFADSPRWKGYCVANNGTIVFRYPLDTSEPYPLCHGFMPTK